MEFMDVVRTRRSIRAYKPDPVPQEHLLQILEAGRLAPSACNQQRWRFAVVRDPELRRRIVEEGFLPGSPGTSLRKKFNSTWRPVRFMPSRLR